MHDNLNVRRAYTWILWNSLHKVALRSNILHPFPCVSQDGCQSISNILEGTLIPVLVAQTFESRYPCVHVCVYVSVTFADDECSL
jgi:hypothetical protein